MRKWRSGQSQQTVNLPASAFEGSNPSLRTNTEKSPNGDFSVFVRKEDHFLAFFDPL